MTTERIEANESAPPSAAYPETPLDAAILEAADEHTVTVLGKTFRLVKDLSLIVTYSLDKAQREESVSGLVDALSGVIHRGDRDAFRDLILTEPEDENDEPISLEAFFDIFSDALQKVAGRPLDT